MFSRKSVLSGCGVVLFCLSLVRASGPPGEQEDQRLGDGSSLRERLEWFQDLKFGLFVHFGIYSQWGCIESWPLVEADQWARPDDLKAWTDRGKDIERFKADYRKLNETFQPVHFDPRDWARDAAHAGMKYFIFTTKHHDGFALFDTRQSDYRVTHPSCPFSGDPRANIAAEAFKAFREFGFAIGAYFSKSDWHSSYYWSPEHPATTRNPNYDTLAEPDKWKKFVGFVHSQVEELMTGYGPIDILWLDGGQVRPPKQDIQMDRLAEMARRHQPRVIFVDRTVGGRHENYRTPEQKVPDKPLDYTWETCMTMGDQWSYKPSDRYKSTHNLVHLLIDVVAKGGNLLLNVGPQPDGRFPEEARKRLMEIGDWMKVNSQAIYGTRAVQPYRQGRFAFTRKGSEVFVFYLMAEGEDHLPSRLKIPFQPKTGSSVLVLGVPQSLAWVREDTGFAVELPDEVMKNPPSRHAVVLRISPGQGAR